MCRRQGYMIQDMERKCVATAKFQETHNKIDDILHEVVLQIAKNVTNDLIKTKLKPCIVNTIIEDRDAFSSEVPAFVSQEFKAHTLAIIKELFKKHVQSNVIHVHQTTTTSTKTESFANLQYQLEDDFRSHHDEHQDNDAPPEGEKRVKRSKESKRSKSAKGSSSRHSRKDSTTYVSKQQSQQQEKDAWEDENVIDEDEAIPKDVTPGLMAESQNVNKRVPTIFNHARMEATLRDSLNLFFLKYGNTEEKKYNLSLHKIDAEEFPEPDLEEKLNRWVRKEFTLSMKMHAGKRKLSNKGKLNSINITFPGIKEHAPYIIVDEPQMGLIYLNSKDKKRVMYLEEIVKFCYATLEKVLNEVKLIMFESKFLKKPPLLSELDQDIIKA
nr:hypothetical protein [Tanacetum cinerariifolium]